MRSSLLVVVLFVLACSKAPAPAAPPPPPPPPVEPVVEDAGTATDLTAITLDERRCTSSAECALITEDCCGCDGGGRQVGVRKDRIAGIAERRTPICSVVACTQMRSDDPSCDARRARCMDGECVADFKGAKTSGVAVEPIDDAQK